MPRKSRGKVLGEILDNQEADHRNTHLALRLQVLAWRQIALIGLVDPERGRKLSQTMFFNSVPFVNDIVVKQIINDTLTDAEEAGKKAGVFT